MKHTDSFNELNIDSNRKIVLFGGGLYGELAERVIRELYKTTVFKVVDNKTKVLSWSNIDVIRTEELALYDNLDIIICAAFAFDSILNELKEVINATSRVYDGITIFQDLIKGIEDNVLSSQNHYIYGELDLHELIDKYCFCAGMENGYNKKLYLPYCVLCITTRCTLKCKNCGAFINNYNEKVDYDVNRLQSSFKKLLDVVDGIHELELMGGEPLIHKEFNKILRWSIEQDKIKAIKIITNGTVFPSSETWDLLKNYKVKLVVDDYGTLSKRYNDIVEYARRNSVRVEEQKLQTWYYLGNLGDANSKSDEEYKTLFSNCNFRGNFGVTNGKFYHCNVAGHMYNSGILNEYANDCIDLEAENDNTLYDKLYSYMNIPYMQACKHCAYSMKREVKVAEQ